MSGTLTYIRSFTLAWPRVGVVVGSGLGAFADELTNPIAMSYADIPGWPQSTAVPHAGKLVVGSLEGLDIAVLAGTAHFYEGYTPPQVTTCVRILAQLCVNSIVSTHAACGLNTSY